MPIKKIILNEDLPFDVKVTMGAYGDMSTIDKFGLNSTITTGSAPEDVWESGGTYPFSTTADIVSLSSSNAGDAQIITVVGLDADGLQVSQPITLNGQTRVALTTSLLRVFRLENDSNTELLGTVFCYSGTTNAGGVPSGGSIEKARIEIGNNQTQMAVITIPKDKVGFLFRGEIGMSFEGNAGAGTNFAMCSYRSRRPNGVFKVKKTITLINHASSIFQDTRSFKDVIPGLTDVKITVDDVSEDMGIWATLDILLVDSTSFPNDFLVAIGQPV